MQIAFHGATTIKASLEDDIRNAAQAGYSALEIWTEKLDVYLETQTPADLKALFETYQIKPMTLNSIEAIGFRGAEFPMLLERCKELCQIATVIGSPAIAVIPSSKPELQTPWQTIVDEHVRVLRELSSVAKAHGIKLAFEFLGSSWEGDSVSDREIHNTSHFYTIGICTVREKGERERESERNIGEERGRYDSNK